MGWASIGYCHQDALDQNTAVAAALASFPPHRVATADTHAAVAARCGAHYTDCELQPQAHGCSCHFSNATFYDVTGPAIGATLAHALKRAAGHHAGHEHRGGGDDGTRNRRRHLKGVWR